MTPNAPRDETYTCGKKVLRTRVLPGRRTAGALRRGAGLNARPERAGNAPPVPGGDREPLLSDAGDSPTEAQGSRHAVVSGGAPTRPRRPSHFPTPSGPAAGRYYRSAVHAGDGTADRDAGPLSEGKAGQGQSDNEAWSRQ